MKVRERKRGRDRWGERGERAHKSKKQKGKNTNVYEKEEK